MGMDNMAAMGHTALMGKMTTGVVLLYSMTMIRDPSYIHKHYASHHHSILLWPLLAALLSSRVSFVCVWKLLLLKHKD